MLLQDHVVQNLNFLVEVALNVSILCLGNIDDSVLLRFQDLHFFFLVGNFLLQLDDFVLNFLEGSFEAIWQQAVHWGFDGQGLAGLTHNGGTCATHCTSRKLARTPISPVGLCRVGVSLSDDGLRSIGVTQGFGVFAIQVTAVVVGLWVKGMSNLH